MSRFNAFNIKTFHQKALTSATVLLLLAANLSRIFAYADRVLTCHDGDTCRVEGKEGIFKLRFQGIDAPEFNQPFGINARDRLMELVDGKEVTTACKGTSYDRKTCNLYVGKEDVSAVLVKEGYAWDYPEFSKGRYKALQEEAQAAHRGLWSQATQVSPFCWRWPNKPKCQASDYQP